MKTLKTVSALMGAATLLTAPGAFAQLSELNITAPGYNGPQGDGDQAGPYTVQIIGTPSTPDPIYTGADGQPLASGATVAFQTFCIASQVDYSPGNYYYQANTEVQPFAGGTPGGLGYVAWGVAYLYNQYLNNPGAFGGPGNSLQADAIQEAIWTLQDQVFIGVVSLGTGVTQSEVQGYLTADLMMATNAATLAGKSVTGNDPNAFGVEALNMTTSSSGGGDWVQPQLVDLENGSQGSPVPEPSTVFAGALMLLPLGISAVRMMRKKAVV